MRCFQQLICNIIISIDNEKCVPDIKVLRKKFFEQICKTFDNTMYNIQEK